MGCCLPSEKPSRNARTSHANRHCPPAALLAESQFRLLHHAVSFQDDSLSGLKDWPWKFIPHIPPRNHRAESGRHWPGLPRRPSLETKRINGALPALAQAIKLADIGHRLKPLLRKSGIRCLQRTSGDQHHEHQTGVSGSHRRQPVGQPSAQATQTVLAQPPQALGLIADEQKSKRWI